MWQGGGEWVVSAGFISPMWSPKKWKSVPHHRDTSSHCWAHLLLSGFVPGTRVWDQLSKVSFQDSWKGLHLVAEIPWSGWPEVNKPVLKTALYVQHRQYWLLPGKPPPWGQTPSFPPFPAPRGRLEMSWAQGAACGQLYLCIISSSWIYLREPNHAVGVLGF